MAEGFDIAQTGRVRRIGIARPETGNTITDPMLEHLADLVAEAGRDESVHAVLLSGAGPDFCLGRERGGGPPPATAFDAHRDVVSKILAVYAAFRACPVPVVARVRGRALGFGCALVGGADVALASTDARFALPEMLHGTPPTLAMSALAGVARKTVADMVYSTEEIDALHALAVGIVSRLTAPEELDAAVEALLDRLAGLPRTDIATVKRFLATGPGLPPDVAADLAGYTMATVKSRR